MNACTDRSHVYREAARLFESRAKGWGGYEIDYACEALEKSAAGNLLIADSACRKMKEVFAPDSDSIAWLAIEGCYEDSEKQRGFRILALCFMAAMVEAGDA